jgi:hypothetical protein
MEVGEWDDRHSFPKLTAQIEHQEWSETDFSSAAGAVVGDGQISGRSITIVCLPLRHCSRVKPTCHALLNAPQKAAQQHVGYRPVAPHEVVQPFPYSTSE